MAKTEKNIHIPIRIWIIIKRDQLMLNLWKDLSPGPNPPNEVYAIIEVPNGSSNKYEYNYEKGYFQLDRVLYSVLYYPADYGIIPKTWSLDKDPLDIMVLTTKPTFTGCIVVTRPIGALTTEDEEGEDDKILGVPVGDPRLKGVHNIKDIAVHNRLEIEDFFLNYKKLEPRKWVNVKGWRDVKVAKNIIASSITSYKETFEHALRK
jgi:inorganic pyrophosphatase